MDFIVGTAGHIDHGKTALVKALTGTDADRLPDEKRRGITIDLGFAEMTAGDVHFGFVDVPGHERFVRNMLAGASGIDMVLLVVAADEGVMPQTREHFDICRLLVIKAGVIVLTKVDLVDKETLDLAVMEVRELAAGSFLDGAEIIPVSSKTGIGIGELRTSLSTAASTLPSRSSDLITRLPIDRSFTVKGFGTVVTGTLASGHISQESRLELMPDGIPVRVRGVQTHGRANSEASAGQRTAVNLANIDHKRVSRGMTLIDAGTLKPTQAIDAEVEVLPTAKPFRSRQRVRFHIGTAEVLARVTVIHDADSGVGEIPGGQRGFAQLRLESPIVAVPGERFIIRSYSPQQTIAGGVVLNSFASRHRPKDFGSIRDQLYARLTMMADPTDLVKWEVEHAGRHGISRSSLQAATGLADVGLDTSIGQNLTSGGCLDANGVYVSERCFSKLQSDLIRAMEAFHKSDPIAVGTASDMMIAKALPRVDGNIAQAVVQRLVHEGRLSVEHDLIRLASHVSALTGDDGVIAKRLTFIYTKAEFGVPRVDEAIAEAIAGTKYRSIEVRKILEQLVTRRELVKVTDEFYFSKAAIDDITKRLRNFADSTPDRVIDVAKFKQLTNVSRKYAIPLLEYFDRVGVTRRAGDTRVITK